MPLLRLKQIESLLSPLIRSIYFKMKLSLQAKCKQDKNRCIICIHFRGSEMFSLKFIYICTLFMQRYFYFKRRKIK